ncbi:helix-turn-helix domain-containing protein [Iodobacter fluviatilis]|jgi:AraC-like DNA-binding protein|uniref:AraC family transcriptional regulator n=1 Tax=Iodobacter fluviatilis TaxID=537 RepID=A0A7G3G5Z9_9NEIS|nr:AraC family transcriptional regulator [Iodobacter fluviatilis]QBC42572.1 AraC family transcriptional regulator [Iodobacter fluviatilis]
MLVREWVGNTQGQGWQYLYSQDQLCPFQWHYHPEFELTFTQHAQGIRYIGSDASPFGLLDLALVAPNQPHTWHSSPEGGLKEVQVAYFTLGWLQTLAAQGAPELYSLCQWLKQIHTGVIFSPSVCQELAPQFALLHTLRGLARLSCLLDILARLQQDSEMRLLQGELHNGDRRLNDALSYLQAHYTQRPTLDDLALAAKASSATIKRLFAEQMQTSFSALLVQLRIGKACQLLLHSKQSIPAIAQASGFPTLSQFYRKFVELKGCTPASYRKQYRLP